MKRATTFRSCIGIGCPWLSEHTRRITIDYLMGHGAIPEQLEGVLVGRWLEAADANKIAEIIVTT